MPTLIQKRIAWGYGALVCQSFPLVNVSFEVAQKTETNCLEIVPGNYRLLSCAIHQIGLKYDGTKEWFAIMGAKKKAAMPAIVSLCESRFKESERPD